MNTTNGVLLKVGKMEHIQDLYENGTIFFNTIQYFRELEDKQLRGDGYEGASNIINSLPGTFIIPGSNHVVNFEKIHIKSAYPKVLGNIFCLYCLSPQTVLNPFDFKIDDRIEEFGTHFLMIKNGALFFEKVKKELENQGYKSHVDFVKYYDKDNVNSDLSVFNKPKEYEHQKELRIYIENNEEKFIKITIGSLKEFSQIYESKHLKTLTFTKPIIESNTYFKIKLIFKNFLSLFKKTK